MVPPTGLQLTIENLCVGGIELGRVSGREQGGIAVQKDYLQNPRFEG